MTDAFVHITVEPGEITDVVREIQATDDVTDVHIVTGEFDVIAQLDFGGLAVETHEVLQEELEIEPREKLPERVVNEIEALDNVRSTALNLAFEP